MTRYAAILVAAWMLVGCRAPAPSFDMLAPYGSPKVPAPRTGAIGTSGTYYAPMNQGTQPTVTAPVNPSLPGTAVPNGTPSSQPAAPNMGASATTMAAGTPDVSMASYQAGAPHQVTPPATTIVGGPSFPGAVADASDEASSSSSTLKLSGMPVNDATQPGEPQSFSPAGEPVNISSLPSANSNAPSFLRFINPKTGASNGTVTAAPPASTATTGTWQTR